MMAARIADSALCDLVAHILVANGLSFTVVGTMLGLSAVTISDLERGLPTSLQPPERERLVLFCAIMDQLGFDARAVRQILDTPQAVLGGRTSLFVMADGLYGLRAVNRLAGEMVLQATRWSRVGHNH